MGFMDDIKGVLRDTEDGLKKAGKDLQRALKDIKSAPFVKEMCKIGRAHV